MAGLTEEFFFNIDLVKNSLINIKIHPLSTSDRITFGNTLGISDASITVYDLTLNELFTWTGSSWQGTQIPLGYTPENVANKVTSLDNSTTHYPSTSAVTAAIAAIPILTFNNGLNNNSGVVQLGINPLVHNTDIDTTDAYSIQIGDLDNNQARLLINPTLNALSLFANSTDGSTGSLVSIDDTGASIVLNNSASLQSKLQFDLSFAPTLSDEINSIGLLYNNDYSVLGKLNPLWIPNIGYIDITYGKLIGGNTWSGTQTNSGAIVANAGIAIATGFGLTIGSGGTNSFLNPTALKFISGGGETDYQKNLISFKNLTGGFRQDIIPTIGTTTADAIYSLPNKSANDTFAMISDLSSFGGGTVTSLTDNTANGVAITWTSRTTVPVPTVVLGAIIPTSTNGVSAATMAFVDPTSSIQTQLNSKLSSSTAASTYVPYTGATGNINSAYTYVSSNGTAAISSNGLSGSSLRNASFGYNTGGGTPSLDLYSGTSYGSYRYNNALYSDGTHTFQIAIPSSLGGNTVATFRDLTGTVAYLSDITTAGSGYMKLSGGNSVTGVQGYTGTGVSLQLAGSSGSAILVGAGITDIQRLITRGEVDITSTNASLPESQIIFSNTGVSPNGWTQQYNSTGLLFSNISTTNSITFISANNGDIQNHNGDYFAKNTTDTRGIINPNYSTFSQLGVGTGNTSITPKIQVIETSTSTTRGVWFDQYSTGTQSSRAYFRKARGTFSSPTTIVTGDIGSNFVTSMYDGTNFLDIAQFRTTSTGTVGTGNISAFTELQTSNAGTLSTAQTWFQDQTVAFPHYTTNGLLKTSSSTGLLAIATAGTDFQSPLTFSTGLSGTTTITIDQSFTPTWTGIHTFNNATSSAIFTNGETQWTGTGSANGIALYHVTGTPYEKLVINDVLGTFEIGSYIGTGGTIRGISIGTQPTAGATNLTGGRVFTIGATFATSKGLFDFTTAATGSSGSMITTTGSLSSSSAMQNILSIQNTISQSTTGGYNALLVTVFENTLGSGAHNLANFTTNSAANNGGTQTSKWKVDNTGLVTQAGAIVFNGSTSGTITRGVQAIAGTYTILAPSATPTTGQVEAYASGGNTWVTPVSGFTFRGSGVVTLVAGVGTVSITGVTTSSIATVGLNAYGGTVSTTTQYKWTCTSGTLTITAVTSTGTTDTTDTSIIGYFVVN